MSTQPSGWIGNGALDGFLEDESLFGEFLRTPVSEGGAEPPVVGPPHAAVGAAPRLPDRGVAVPVHELLPQQPIRRLDHGVAVGATPARQRSFDVEHVERLVDPRVVEPAAPVGAEHLDVRQREVEVYFVKLICTVSSLFLDSFVVHSGRFGLSGFLLVLFGYFISEWVFL